MWSMGGRLHDERVYIYIFTVYWLVGLPPSACSEVKGRSIEITIARNSAEAASIFKWVASHQ
jgi:hypothetical protein